MKFTVTLDCTGFAALAKVLKYDGQEVIAPPVYLPFPVFYKVSEVNGSIITTKYRMSNISEIYLETSVRLELETTSDEQYTMGDIIVHNDWMQDLPAQITLPAHVVLAFCQIIPGDEADMYEMQVMFNYWHSLTNIRHYEWGDSIITVVNAINDKVDSLTSDVAYTKTKADEIKSATTAIITTLAILDGINIAVSTTLPALILSNFTKLNKRLKNIFSDYDPAGILSGTDQD